MSSCRFCSVVAAGGVCFSSASIRFSSCAMTTCCLAISALRTAISFCCADTGWIPATKRMAANNKTMRFIDAPSHKCTPLHEDTLPLLPVIGCKDLFQYIADGARDRGPGDLG